MTRRTALGALFVTPLLGPSAMEVTGQANAADSAEALVEAGRKAFESYDLVRAARLYEAAAANEIHSPASRLAALRALAQFDWKFDRNVRSATNRLTCALKLSPADRTAVHFERGTIWCEAEDFEQAFCDAEAALGAARSSADAANARTLYGQTAVASVLADPASEHVARITQAIEHIDAALALEPGRSDTSEALIGLGILSNRGEAVLRGFMSYFFFAEETAVSELMRKPYECLERLAKIWHGAPLPIAERTALASALGEARFHDWAAYVARSVAARNAELEGLIAYQQFLESVARVNDDIYPRVAKGLRDYREEYDEAMAAAVRTLLAALGESGPEPAAGTESFFKSFFSRIAARFGLEGYLGTTVDFYGMLAGHTVVDERRRIEQYDYAGDFRFLSLDRLASRDFTSWYGTTNVGGWGTETTMIQVRQAYLVAPYRQLSWVTDPAAARRLDERIATLEVDDRKRCERDPYAEPYGLPLRIRLQASRRVHAELADRGLAGPALAVGFIAEILRLTTEATVFAHEGRHSLDQLHFSDAFSEMPNDERELRAKFSEVAFSLDPKYALTGSIIGARLDETSGHGKANRRFRTLLVDWMAARRDEIDGLDATLPLIMQADRLSNAQLLQFTRSVDPMVSTLSE